MSYHNISFEYMKVLDSLEFNFFDISMPYPYAIIVPFIGFGTRLSKETLIFN